MRPLTITRQIQIDLHIHNTGIQRARLAYSREQGEIEALTAEQLAFTRAKAVRKAAAQKRYRDREGNAR